jgi:micrococcal nuclease
MRKLITYLCLALFIGIVLVGCSKGSDIIVSKVYDGDSFVLSNGDGVRLIGIDAPEKGEPGAEEARSFLIGLIEGKHIRLEPDKENRDKYNRLLRYVYINDTFVNAEMIKNGYATTLFIPPNDKYRQEFTAFENAAKDAQKGLWAKQETPKGETVYITNTGNKYHRAECESLSKSKIPMELKEAKAKGYEPCKVCDPPK